MTRIGPMVMLSVVAILLLATSGVVSGWSVRPKLRALLRPRIVAAPGPVQVIGGVAAVGTAALIVQNQIERRSPQYTPERGTLTGQTIVITGASTGLGLESAKRLALGSPSKLVLTVRTESKGQDAVDAVRAYLKEKNVNNEEDIPEITYKLLDLDNLESIKQSVAESWDDIDQIDCLLNNAGVMALPDLEVTIDNIEKQIQSNHLGHFVLTALLAPKFASNARIINVSSSAHEIAARQGGLDFDYMWKPSSSSYGAWKSYGQSKLANILFTQELQRKVDSVACPELDWTVACLHPGVVGTDLGRYLFGTQDGGFASKAAGSVFNLFIKTPQQGATTQIWLASRGDEYAGTQNVRGRYVSDCKVQNLHPSATNADQAARLWKESEEIAGVAFDLDGLLASKLIVEDMLVAGLEAIADSE